MRISADPQSPHYNAALIPSLVYLQGQLLERVLYADEEKGCVIVAAVDERGNLRVKNNEVVTEVHRGHVKIVPMLRQ